MTPVELKSKIYKESRTTSSNYLDADMLSDVNEAFDDIAEEIIKVDENYYDVPCILPLQAGSREIQIPVDKFGPLSKVSIKLNGKLVVADPLPIPPKISLEDEDAILGLYSNDDPKYILRRDAIFILCREFTTEEHGLYLTYSVRPAHLTDFTGTNDLARPTDTTQVGIPVNFQKLIPFIVSKKYKIRNKVPLTDRESNIEVELMSMAEAFRKKDNRMENIFSTGSEETRAMDYGFNL